MPPPVCLPLGTSVIYNNSGADYQTVVVGYETTTGDHFILVKNIDGTPIPGFQYVNGFLIDDDWADGIVIDQAYAGGRGFWVHGHQLRRAGSAFEVPKAKPKGPDGCSCIHCNNFCEMSATNLMKTSELNDPEVKPSAIQKAFACYSCRDTVAWWIRSQGWTFTG